MTPEPSSLSDAVRALAAWEREHPAEAAAVRAEDTAHLLEREAEQHARELAELAWKQHGGEGDGPSVQQLAEADRAARALLAQELGEAG